MVEVTVASAAQSILTWDQTKLKIFNDGNHPWVVSNNGATGDTPNTPEEVAEFLGNQFNSKSFEVTVIVKNGGGKLGVELTHNPCF